MPAIHPVPKETASAELKDVYDKLSQVHGRIPNFFGVLAQRPAALEHFLGLYSAVINHGTIEPKYKELAYLKTARVNGCEY